MNLASLCSVSEGTYIYSVGIHVSAGTKNTPQLILLDHGLHKTLVPELRANYAGLWKVISCHFV